MAVEVFTYNGDPTTSAVNLVRFYTGDTDRDLAELDDREIAFAITNQSNPKLAAAELLDALATKYARKANITVGQVSKQMGTISDTLRKRAEDLRATAGNLALPFFGGLTKTGKNDLSARTDDVQPHFTIGQFDNPQASQFDGETPDDEV